MSRRTEYIITISTHAPRVRRDCIPALMYDETRVISTHAPRVRRDVAVLP